MNAQLVQHLIDGDRVGDPAVERRNPADPADVVAVAPSGDPADVDAAIAAARRAQPSWAAMPAPSRGALLDRASAILASRAGEAARDLVREEGKTLAEAAAEVQRAVDILRYFGGEGWRLSGSTIPSAAPDTFVYTKREPVGIAAAITPWNFPIAIPAWKIAPALVAGNAVVLKPAELTPLSARNLASALAEAGLPRGVLNVVYGSGSAIGATLVGDERVGAVSFTGSTAVGRQIHDAVARRMGRVQLEMGGKNPVVVTDDADLDRAASIVAASAFGLTGQACTAASRLIASPAIVDELVERLRLRAERYRPGNGLDEGVLMGPVVSGEQLETDRRYLELARVEGAQVVSAAGEAEGLFLPPAIVRAVEPEHTIAQEEVFGPVLAVLEADDFDEAVEVANGVAYGLTAGIVTSDLAKAHRFADRVQAGVVKVNRPTVGLDLNVPFGGVKDSSTGTFREQGSVAVEFFTWSKSVYMGVEE